MATVNKDFRVKNGLVVEGTTATVNGNNILTTASTISSDSITEGSNNLFFTDARALAAVGENLSLTDLSDVSVNPSSGSYLKFSGNEWVAEAFQGDVWSQFSYGDGLSFLEGNLSITADTDIISEGSTNLYFTDARAVAAVESGTFSSIAVDQLITSNGLFSIDNVIAISSTQGSASITIGGETVATETYVNTAVSNLVDTAPETLDTLNELAAALGDDENFSTTVTTAIGEKVAKAGDTMTGYLSLHANPESDLHAATKQYVDSAISSGIDGINTDVIEEGNTNLYYTDARVASLLRGATLTNIQITGGDPGEALVITAENGVADSTTDNLAEGSTNLYFTGQRAIDALNNATITPLAVEGVSHVDYEENSTILRTSSSHQIISNQSGTIAIFQTSDFSGAKAVIKITDSVSGNTEILEAIVLFDASGNGHVTEYGNVFTSSQLSDGIVTTFGEGQATISVDTTISSGTVDAFLTMIP